MIATDTPCAPWPLDQSCWDLPEGDHSAIIDGWHEYASTILWRLSGRRWGLCERTVRPCLRSCLDGYPGFYGWSGVATGLYPYVSGGRWYNATTCGCGDRCACGRLCEVYLPGPVNKIDAVVIDGVAIDPSEYRVDAPGLLVRQSDECWPSCQDLSAPAGSEGTFTVTYTYGLPVDESATQAVSAFTRELVKACIPGCKDCQLPKRVTTIARQNVSAQFIDPQEFLNEGKTGVYTTDLWLASVNPGGLVAPSRVMSPDARPTRRTTIA